MPKNEPPSPVPMVLLGVFGAPHGVRGEIRLKSYTADPLAITDYGPLTGSDGRSYTLTAARPQKDMLIVRVAGIGDRTAAERLVNIRLSAPRERLGTVDEDEDEFFHADLVGLLARTPDGTLLGRVIAIPNFGAGDLLEVAPETGRSLLFPFTKAVVPVIDIAGGALTVVPPVEVGEREPSETGAERQPQRRRPTADAPPEPAPDGPPRRRGKP
ncbi:MAG: ribosome maturation factor RimM [Labrys sp. (in: a-proteobacteria)]